MTGKPRECIHSAASGAWGEVIWRLWLQEEDDSAGTCSAENLPKKKGCPDAQ